MRILTSLCSSSRKASKAAKQSNFLGATLILYHASRSFIGTVKFFVRASPQAFVCCSTLAWARRRSRSDGNESEVGGGGVQCPSSDGKSMKTSWRLEGGTWGTWLYAPFGSNAQRPSHQPRANIRPSDLISDPPSNKHASLPISLTLRSQ